MAFDFQKLAGLVKAYGSPLYGSVPVKEHGQITPDEYTIEDGVLVCQDSASGVVYYIPIRKSVVDAGIAPDRVFNIGEFEATRDADGEYNGKAWSIKKGETKTFAY